MADDQVLVAPEGAEELLAVSNLIKEHIEKLEHVATTIKKHQQMLNDILDNDETYREHTKLAKEASKLKNQTKQQILRQPQARDIVEKIKESRVQIKDLREALSDYVTQYQKMTGAGEFEDSQGNLRKIIFVAKLVKA